MTHLGDKTMAKLVALYKTPSNASEFDAHYTSTHAPLAKKMPGLQHYEISTGPIKGGGGDTPYYLAAILTFPSLEAIQQSLGSPEGKAVADDLGKFAQAGVELLMFDTKDA
jgi:uncharacterized protein (TIGR02118 family)